MLYKSNKNNVNRPPHERYPFENFENLFGYMIQLVGYTYRHGPKVEHGTSTFPLSSRAFPLKFIGTRRAFPFEIEWNKKSERVFGKSYIHYIKSYHMCTVFHIIISNINMYLYSYYPLLNFHKFI